MNNNNNNNIDVNDSDLSDELSGKVRLELHGRNQRDQNEEEEEDDIDEKCLSQQLSQLLNSEMQQAVKMKNSATTKTQRSPPTTTFATLKKLKTDNDRKNTADEINGDDDIIQESVPKYLSLQNQEFQHLVDSLLFSTHNTLFIGDMQEIALLLRRIAITNLRTSLWKSYLQSGTGELEVIISGSNMITNEQISIWSSEVKSTLLILEEKKKKKKQQQKTSTTDEPFAVQINNETCLSCVNQVLHQYEDQIEEANKNLTSLKHRLNNKFTSQMENGLVEFIEQQELKYLRIEIEKKRLAVKYDYYDRFLRCKYTRYQPTRYEQDVFDNIIRIKREQVTSMYEAGLLKQRRFYQHIPEPLHSLELPLHPSLSIDTIIDKTSREELTDQYTEITEKTKLEIMALYIDIAEVKANENQRKLEQNVLLLEANSHERFSCLYDLKVCALQLQRKTSSNRDS